MWIFICNFVKVLAVRDAFIKQVIYPIPGEARNSKGVGFLIYD